MSGPLPRVSRVALMPIPGTAAAPGGPDLTIEAIEIKGIRSRSYNPNPVPANCRSLPVKPGRAAGIRC